MSTSQLAIWNLSLSHLGVSVEVADVTERSKEAQACRRFYDQVIGEVLRDFPWPFATTFASLALVATAPTAEWAYSYRQPVDCTRFIRVLPGLRVDTPSSRIPFRLGYDSTGSLVFCDLTSAQAEYTTNLVNESRFTPDFTQMAALLLAGYLGPRVTKGDDFKLGDRALKLYEWRKAMAWQNAAGEQARDLSDASSFLDARAGGTDSIVRPSNSFGT